ncbi:hypothetical protein PILCRDRAFT_810722 [Piloderma croceum F 1598]|uniref:Uncharacterized protein n=1 Tax=Piloderma croceum (strain F 1598) TaxID=765440 RepID=A0A0C3G5A4_PILCF|nr:hypothetical protein PILCRDRAFT_810722 [Piloderma croceum F 1598]
MPGSESEHKCWKDGCNKKKTNCTAHYWKCYGTGTRTHGEQKVMKGGKCESNSRDTVSGELAKCGLKEGE